MSGSCSVQTCWLSLNSFDTIAADIKRMYDDSVLINLNNFGEIDDDDIREDQLAYLTGNIIFCE